MSQILRPELRQFNDIDNYNNYYWMEPYLEKNVNFIKLAEFH